MYDMSVSTHIGRWQPLRALTADQVVPYALDALRMMGRAYPDWLVDPAFPTLLAETGEYTAKVDDDIEISVWRAA